jgi:predicted phage tail protein
MNSVFLHGDLAEKFGSEHELHVSTPREAMKALCVIKPGFKDHVKAGEYKIIRKPKKNPDAGLVLDDLTINIGMSDTDLHVIPMPAGSKSGGAGKIILGIALVGAAIITGGGAAALGGAISGFAAGTSAFTFSVGLGLFGGAMVLGGISQMLMPTPDGLSTSETEEQPASFLLNGPVNVGQQGNAIPLVYGRVRTGSVVVSSGLGVEQIGIYRGGSSYDNSDDSYYNGLFDYENARLSL